MPVEHNNEMLVQPRAERRLLTRVKLTPESFTWGGRFKNTYGFLNRRALKSAMDKIYILQCNGMIFCVEFQRYPSKFHTKYRTYTLKDMIFIQRWNFAIRFKNSYAFYWNAVGFANLRPAPDWASQHLFQHHPNLVLASVKIETFSNISNFYQSNKFNIL